MKYILKKYWYIFIMALIINIPLMILCTVRTDKSIVLKGDTTIVEDFVEIENAYKAEGSFSTIYVISMDYSTIMQNILAGNDSTSEVSDLPQSYLHLSTAELTEMGRIQHTSSIMYSIMLAYKEAKEYNENINLESNFECFKIAYYAADSEYRIGDEIVGVNGIYAKDDFELFRTSFNNRQEGDIFNVIRGEEEIAIICNEKNMKISGYAYYKLNKETAFPNYSIKTSNVGGSSGGLLQTLSLLNSLIEEDITKGKKIAGTGTIDVNGKVGAIGGITQKIYTAFDDNVEIFLCPEDNYEEALLAYNKLKNKEKMKLFSVGTLQEALEVLANE